MSIATATPVPEQRLFLSAVSWATYDALLHALDGRHLRLTYCQGELEIMRVSAEHERAKKVLTRLLHVLTEELDIPIRSLGNTTFRREDLSRGLEPDESWYIQHEEQMRAKTEIDLSIDPPPDLVIEVEVSRSVLDRLEIYARLGVPEVWRCDGQTLRVWVLGEDGRYVQTNRSPTFPQVPLEGLVQFLNQRGQMDETRLVKSFRAWVQATVTGKTAPD